MFIIAGPPGGGKTSVLSRVNFDGPSFNADDRAAQLNNGSYVGIPQSIRTIVNREFENFVQEQIRCGNSFAIETTLRSTISFEQAKLAKSHGFDVTMRYVALASVEQHIERVIRRAFRGGHSASEPTLRRIHAASMSNLPLALNPAASGVDFLRVYDNSVLEASPLLVLVADHGRITYQAPDLPDWVRNALPAPLQP